MAIEVLTINQVSKELNIAKNTIYRYARTGKMPGWIRIGDRWLISRKNLEKFVNAEVDQ